MEVRRAAEVIGSRELLLDSTPHIGEASNPVPLKGCLANHPRKCLIGLKPIYPAQPLKDARLDEAALHYQSRSQRASTRIRSRMDV